VTTTPGNAEKCRSDCLREEQVTTTPGNAEKRRSDCLREEQVETRDASMLAY